jgi:hypothetical protein
MVQTNRGGLHKVAPQHVSPPPYIFVAGDFNFSKKNGPNSADFTPDPSEAPLLRFSTPVPPPITMAHHEMACPPHCSTRSPMTTQPSPLCLRSVRREIYENG